METNHEQELINRFAEEIRATAVETGYIMRETTLTRMYMTGQLMDQYQEYGLPVGELENIVSENFEITTRTIKNYRRAYAWCQEAGYESLQDLIDRHPKQKAISLESIYEAAGIKTGKIARSKKEEESVRIPLQAFKAAKKLATNKYKKEPKIRNAVVEIIEYIRKFKA